MKIGSSMVFSKLLSEGYQSVTITGMLNSRNHQLETTNVTKILQNLELLYLYVCVWVWGGREWSHQAGDQYIKV